MEDEIQPIEKVELAMIRAEHQKRYQVMIGYIKEQVGEGVEYRNSIVRVVVSDRGTYAELTDLPEEFCGAVGGCIERRFVAPGEAIALLGAAATAAAAATGDNTRQLSIFALYTRRGLVDRKNCYVYEFRPGRTPLVIGGFRPERMPLYFRVKIEADWAEDVLGVPGGTIFCMANAGDRHLFIRIPMQADQITDLALQPPSSTTQ